jgi:N-acetylmuramoyl-L-alanine amidase
MRSMPKYRVGRLCGRPFHRVWRGRSFAASTLRLLIAAAAVVAIVSAPVGMARAGGKALDHPRCDRDGFRVVLDIGHSLDAPGATSARGVPEYQFNLLLAEEVQKALDKGGFAKTVLLNTFGPARKSLFGRVAAANALDADLFLSIHHDSVPQFLKEEWQFEAQQNAFSDRFRGHSLFVSAGNRQYGASLVFGRTLGRELKTRGLDYTPHYTMGMMGPWRRALVDASAGVYRYDQLIVLRTAHMPAVLLEAGSIVNREEELLLASTERQTLIATSVFDAVAHFCALRSKSHARRRVSGRPAARVD